jgi:opacity protein-like surface antigen
LVCWAAVSNIPEAKQPKLDTDYSLLPNCIAFSQIQAKPGTARNFAQAVRLSRTLKYKKGSFMRKYLLAAAAAVVFTTPAAAKDHSGYVGLEGGVLFPQKQDIDGTIDFTAPPVGVTDFATNRVARVKFKTGYDVDLIGGYDFGMFRLEGELGYKRAKNKSIRVDDAFVTNFNAGAGTLLTADDFDLGGHTSVLSGMIIGLVDFGGNGGSGAYAGGGVGYARV